MTMGIDKVAMGKYKAFISYRKSHATNADLVKKALVEEYGFESKEIFLDKHDIGPEYFDTKLKNAIESSSCLILIVTQDCFVPKEEGEDWYLREVATALKKGIAIIPLLFDGVRSLDIPEIKVEMEKTFSKDDVNKLIKTQSIPYDFDLSDATFSKLSSFVRKADKSDITIKSLRVLKILGLLIALLTVVFVLFVGIGFLWGYLSSGTDDKDILVGNTHIEGNAAIFEFGGLEAKYDLDEDSIYIDLQNFTGELPESDLEILAHSCSVSGAMILLDKNISAIKHFKFLKNGSKQSKIVMAVVTVTACIGSFCGFSQGSKWGRTLKQQRDALELFPKLRSKEIWAPVFVGNIRLNVKYIQSSAKRKKLGSQTEIYNVLNDFNTLTFCYPSEGVSIAREQGLNSVGIVCRFNNWEIGKGTAQDLSDEIERSKMLTKNVVVFEIDSLHQEMKHFSLPVGTVGIIFRYPDKKSDISSIVEKYNEWKVVNKE